MDLQIYRKMCKRSKGRGQLLNLKTNWQLDFDYFCNMDKTEKRFYIYLLLWFIADLIQASVTNVHADEAYYALYGQFLDWGYYDHPPMVGLMTFLSHWAPGYLSIRLLTVLLHSATLLLVWKTIRPANPTIRDVNEFCIISLSLFMFVLYGFITTPDAPLLFFVALFFYLYKLYQEKNKVWIAMLIGVAIAGMLYSKYMAVLVVAFVLLSNYKLLKDWRMWLAIAFAAMLFMPHVLWQTFNGFPSLKYHFLVRKDPFSWSYILEFIPSQLLVFNPVCFILALYFCWRERKNKDTFIRAIVFTTIGFFAFFWVMTINGHAEPHWTVATSIPILYILFMHTREHVWRKRIMIFVLPFAMIIIIARIALLFPNVPEQTGFGNRRPLINAMHKLCENTPTIFYSSFQYPSIYRYYTGENATALSSVYNRMTQYDILQLDKDLQGKEVAVLSPYSAYGMTKIDDFEFYYKRIQKFQGTNRIDVIVDRQIPSHDSIELYVTLKNNYSLPFDFKHEEMPVGFDATYMQQDKLKIEHCIYDGENVIPANGSICGKLKFKRQDEGNYVICLRNHINTSVNSKAMEIPRDND